MSYRLERLLWARHRAEFFVGLLLAFWVAAMVTARRLACSIQVERN